MSRTRKRLHWCDRPMTATALTPVCRGQGKFVGFPPRTAHCWHGANTKNSASMRIVSFISILPHMISGRSGPSQISHFRINFEGLNPKNIQNLENACAGQPREGHTQYSLAELAAAVTSSCAAATALRPRASTKAEYVLGIYQLYGIVSGIRMIRRSSPHTIRNTPIFVCPYVRMTVLAPCLAH